MAEGQEAKGELLSDLQLLEACAAGEASAFHELIDRHGPELLRLARSLSRSRSDAEDIVQETLIGVYRGVGRFDGRSSVRTWLCRILMRQAARAWNRGKRRRAMASLDAVEVERLDVVNDGRRGRASIAVADVDCRLDLDAALEMLNEDHRTVIMLRELRGLSYGEIAQMLGVPQGTVESRLHRARAELRGKLKGYGKSTSA